METLPIKTLPSVSSLFKESFKIYKKYFWGLMGISVFLILPMILRLLSQNVIYRTIVVILGDILLALVIPLVLIYAIKIYISSEQKNRKNCLLEKRNLFDLTISLDYHIINLSSCRKFLPFNYSRNNYYYLFIFYFLYFSI